MKKPSPPVPSQSRSDVHCFAQVAGHELHVTTHEKPQPQLALEVQGASSEGQSGGARPPEPDPPDPAPPEPPPAGVQTQPAIASQLFLIRVLHPVGVPLHDGDQKQPERL